ncbi:hypothetical protein C0991_010887 [Blastosporella zonata]|nr:hypothetical protein C0991_010887 [Blastosporella zonata]
MSRRMLKRSRRSWKDTLSGSTRTVEDNAEQNSKKPKLKHTIAVSPSRGIELQTPHRTILTEEQVFRIESSRGGALPLDYEFSPVPPASSLWVSKQVPATRGVDRIKQVSHKTSSSNLKENAIPTFHRSSSKSRPGDTTLGSSASKSKPKLSTRGASLASPFTSKPSSPLISSTEPLPHADLGLKRPLSDTHYNPNLPSRQTIQAQSTSSSPARTFVDESMKARRPSAPCASAPLSDAASLFSSYKSTATFRDHILSSSEFFLSGRRNYDHPVDFNRPPSQLSCNFGYDERFFGDALEVSTPFGTRQSLGPTFADSPDSTDDEDTDLHHRTLHSSDMQITRPLSLPSGVLGSWLSDSLISPPTLSHNSAYTRQGPFDQDVDIPKSLISSESSLGLGENPTIPPSQELSKNFLTCEASDVERCQEPLQELFTKLELGLDDVPTSRPHVLRTRSLDLDTDHSSAGRPLQSPAQISPSRMKTVPDETAVVKRAGRDRRGTIRASDFPVSGPSALGGPRRTRSGTVVQGSIRPRRERSDTVRPSTSVVDCVLAPSLDVDVDMLDVTENLRRQELTDVLMTTDEQEDELLLKDHWVDEDWAVAAPPSPTLPLRKRKGHPEWRKRFELRMASGLWGIGKRDDDGKDDPLNLLLK